jgi:hypothetical protein
MGHKYFGTYPYLPYKWICLVLSGKVNNDLHLTTSIELIYFIVSFNNLIAKPLFQ